MSTAIEYDTTKVKVPGPMVALIGADGSETTLGHTTRDGFEFKYTPTFTEVKVDIYGDSVVDMILISERVEVSFTTGQLEAEVLEETIPFGSIQGTDDPYSLYIGEQAGKSAAAEAQRLTVRGAVAHGIGGGSTDDDFDFVLYKAFCMSEVTVPLKFSEEAGTAQTWMGLIDTTGNVIAGFGHAIP